MKLSKTTCDEQTTPIGPRSSSELHLVNDAKWWSSSSSFAHVRMWWVCKPSLGATMPDCVTGMSVQSSSWETPSWVFQESMCISNITLLLYFLQKIHWTVQIEHYMPALTKRTHPRWSENTEQVVIGTKPASCNSSLIGPNPPGCILQHEMSSTPFYLGLSAHRLYKYPVIIL